MDAQIYNVVAEAMLANAKTSQTTAAVAKVASQLAVSYPTGLSYLRCTAQQCRQQQQELFCKVLAYVRQQQRAGLMEGVAVVHRQSFDETKMKVRVPIDEALHHTGLHGSKVFVVQNSWSLLMKNVSGEGQEPASYTMMSGAFSPYLRVAESTRGECAPADDTGTAAGLHSYTPAVRVRWCQEQCQRRTPYRSRSSSVADFAVALHSSPHPQHLRKGVASRQGSAICSHQCPPRCADI